MSREVHEAPIVHGTVSCSSLYLSSLEIMSSSTCVGVDTSLATTDNLVENKIVRSELQTLVPREFNTRVEGDFSGSSPDSNLYSVQQTNTFDGVGVSLGGVDITSGLGVQVPASGLYSSNFVFELSSNTTENVVQLASNAYLEMTNPSNFQENGSFSVDFEWKGTNFDTDVSDGMIGSRVALVSTGESGNYFGIFATKHDSQKYSLMAECSDGSEVLSLDLGQWQKDTWFHILATWSSPQNTLSVQIDRSRFQTTGSFGSVSSRPFYFGYDGTTMGGGFVYKYVRFHQDVLNAYSFENLPLITSADSDGFRCAVVYSGGGVVVPYIAKVGTAVSAIPATSGEVVVSLTTGPSAGTRRVIQSVSLVPGGMKGNETINQTFLSAPGDVVRFESSQAIVTKEISVMGLKFDNMKVPVISLVSESVTVERGNAFTDSGVSAVEIDANGIETDVSSAVSKTADPSTETVGEKYIFYTLTASDGLFTVRRCKKVNVVDTSVPIIVLTGSSEINHERGTVFVDQGGTASDGLTFFIQVHNPVVIDVVGTYTITYDVIDARGNHAQQVTRKVNIIDTHPPIITITTGSNGFIGQTVERLDTYTDPEATAVDQNGNEDITSSIQVSFVRNSDNYVLSEVDVATVGTYTVVYQCDDSAVNSGTPNVATQKQRTVTVVDTTKPRIFLNGPSNLTIERLSGYSDQGATAFDYSSAGVRDTNNEYTTQIVTTNPVDHMTSGTYTVMYNVTDAHGNVADEVTRTVVVQDTTPPVITILGDNPFILERLDTYDTSVDPGATALDGDTNYTSSIVVTNLVNNSDSGTGSKDYDVHYDVKDIAGNSATRKTRTVRVRDTTKPRFFLTGPNDITVERLSTYSDQGATAFDFSSAGVQDNATNLSSQIVVTTTVDMTTVGDYTVRYNVSDVSGNAADEITRTVRVRDTIAPVITITGSTTQTHERLNTYNDSGAIAVDGNGGENVSSRIQVTNNVNASVTGDYTVVYSCTDDHGNSSSITRKVLVRDTTKPRITVTGPTSITHERLATYTDQGGVAFDYQENNQSSGEALTVTTDMGGFDAAVVGVYTITYTVSDAAGNTADPKTRTVTVEDTAVPVVSILGANPVTVERLDTYTDAGATAVDGDIDLSANIVVTGLTTSSTTTTVPQSDASTTATGYSSQYWGNPSWYESESNVLAYYDFTKTASWDSGTSKAVDFGPNNNDITYSADLGTVEYRQASSGNFLATNNIRNDMVLTLGSTYTGTIAMGCWVKLFHGSDGYTTNFANFSSMWSGIMAYGTTQNNGHFFGRGGRAKWGETGSGNVAQYMWDFGIGCESVGQDTWSHSSIGSQTVWDYITGQPDYQNRWWCWQARLTASGRLETSLDGSPFALAQSVNGSEDLATIDLMNSNTSATLPQIRIGCDGHQDNVANNSYGAMFWYRDGEYNDTMALDFYNTFKDTFKPVAERSNILAYYHQGVKPLSGTTMTDLGPNGNNGTVSGAVAASSTYLEWTGQGEIDTGITFQSILDGNSTGEYTVAAKFQYAGTDAQTYSAIFGGDKNDSPSDFFIGKHDGNTSLGFHDSEYQSSYITTPGVFDSTGRASAHTIVVTRSGSLGSYVNRTYIDGEYVQQANFTGVNLEEHILVGNEAGGGGYPFTGKIWQAIVLDKVLPSGEIQALHRSMVADEQYLADNTSQESIPATGIDTNVVGDYNVTYTVQDSSGNSSQATRTVQVRDITAPEITVSNGDVTIARESTYIDAGATAFDKKSDGTDDVNTVLTSSIVTTTKAKAPNGTNTWYVKVVNSGGNKYVFTADSTFTSQGYLLYPEITLTAGETYVFDQSDASNNNHPIRFADSNGGLYSNGVTTSATPGQPGATVTFTVPSYGYTTMKYVCQVHGTGMGHTIYVKASTDSVNTATTQKFQMCYDVSDAESNAATTKYRMVTVSDSLSPSISLTGGTVTIERAIGSYSEPGYSASDGTVDLTSRVVVTHNVNTSAHGDYYYHYDVTDSSGNAATRVSRLVQVRDTRAPVVIVTGGTEYAERYATYNDPGASANDDGTVLSVSTSNPVNTSNVGAYTVTYTATDLSGNTGSATRTVHVQDNTNPIVTMNRTDLNPYYIEVATGSYQEHSATAVDGNGGPALSVSTSGSVNTNVVDTYNIYYTATDSTGKSGQAHRQVIVRDTVAPLITLTGSTSVQLESGSVASYVDAGATVSDASGNAVLSTTNNVNVNSPGSYTFTYTATDGYNNATPVSRTVVVIDATPQVSLVGDASMTVEAGATWTDPGAIATTVSTGSVTNHISINIAYDDEHNITEGAGAMLAENWNHVQRGNTTSMALIDFTGADSGATAITSTGGQYHASRRTSPGPRDGAHGSLFYGYMDNFSGKTMTISNIPSEFQTQGYELRIYHGNFKQGSMGFRVEDGTGYSKTYYSYSTGSYNNYPITGTDQFGGETGYIGSQSEDSNHTTPSNYTFFEGLSGSTLTIMGVNGGTGDTRPRPSGYQISTKGADPVSTPASVSDPVNTSNQTVSTQDMMHILGTYTLQYSASSPSATVATVSRTIVVQDTVAPIFNSFNDVTHERGQLYSDVKPTAYDPRDSGDLGLIVTENFYNVNPNVVGDYQVDYTATDGGGLSTTSRRKNVYVQDTVASVITLTGDGTSSGSPYTWTQGDITTWSDPGYNARDQVDNTNLDSSVSVDSSGIDFNTPGDYQVVYNLNNSAYGPTAVQKIRYVKIEALSPASTLPVTDGLRARYNCTSWKSKTVWEDLSGNGHHMQNDYPGPSEVVSAANANMTDNNTGGTFAYVRGDQDSRWNLGGYSGEERVAVNSWTYIHIHRYDPVYEDKNGRVLGAVGSDTFFGTYNGYVGLSKHNKWLITPKFKFQVQPRFNSHWIFHIERPNKFSRTSTADTSWSDFEGKGQEGEFTGKNVRFRPTISAGQNNEHAAWNIAELIMFDRVLSDSEVSQFKTWMMDYKAGNVVVTG